MSKLIEKHGRYYLQNLDGKTYVLRKRSRAKGGEKDPNWEGTGLACCGILKDGETFNDWMIRIEKARTRIKKDALEFEKRLKVIASTKYREKK